MTKYLTVVFIYISYVLAVETDIKNDNTLIIDDDDFGIKTTYPEKSNHPKELTFIIRNRSKVQFLFGLKKNSNNYDFISLPSLENYTRTISIGQNEMYSLRSLSPPAEDIRLISSLK